ncbi:MAG: YncE family protein [Bacteroidota bacterium]
MRTLRWLLLPLLLIACTAPRAVATDGGGPYVYVANQLDAAVTVVDMSTNEVAATVDLEALGFSANAKPHHIAVEPDGSHWYVSLIGDNLVVKFNRANEVVATAPIETPGMLALDPTTDLLYVGRSMSAVSPPPSIGVVERSTMAADEIDIFFSRPHALVVSGDLGQVYAASLVENSVGSLDTGEETLELLTLDGPIHTLVQFAIAPDGKTMVGTGQLTGQVLFFDLADPANPTVSGVVEVGGMPWHPTYSPDGSRIYVPNQGADAIDILDAETREVVARVEGRGLAEPHGSAVSPDGRFLYVSNRNLKGTYRPDGAPAPDASDEHAGHDMGDMDEHAGHDMGSMEGMDGADTADDMSDMEDMDEHAGHGMGDMDEHAGHDMGGMVMNDNPDFGGTLAIIDTQTNAIIKVIELGRMPSGMSAGLQ